MLGAESYTICPNMACPKPDFDTNLRVWLAGIESFT